ncbi:hypothetical protein [Streptomyces sp. NPDC055210]
MRRDSTPAGTPRQNTRLYIASLLIANRAETANTVGRSVALSIESIQAIAGEIGAREIDRVFMQESMNAYYLTREDSPDASAAHLAIAQAEYRAWKEYDKMHSTPGSEIAVSYTPEMRVKVQMRMGALAQTMQDFYKAGVTSFDPAGTGFDPQVAMYVKPLSATPSAAAYDWRTAGYAAGRGQGSGTRPGR